MGLLHDAKHFEGHFNIIEGHQSSKLANFGVLTPHLVGGSILDANNFESHEGSSKVSEMLGAMVLKMGQHYCRT